MPVLSLVTGHRPGVAAAAVGVGLAVLAWAPSSRDLALPAATSPLWIVPDRVPADGPGSLSAATASLAEIDADDTEAMAAAADAALPVLRAATTDPVVGDYARLHLGRAHLALEHYDVAADAARTVLEHAPGGYLEEAARWLLVESAEAAEDWDAAVRALQVLTMTPHVADPAQAWLRLGLAARERDDPDTAAQAFRHARDDHSLTSEAAEASRQLDDMGRLGRVTRESYPVELRRADRFFEVGRYGEARNAYRALRSLATGDDADRVALRLAICDYHLRRLGDAKSAIDDYVHDREAPARVDEARYYFLSAQRGQRRYDDYIDRVDRFLEMYPESPFAPRALDELGTHYILQDEDDQAGETFARLYAQYPASPQAARAAWKAGWWDYKAGRYEQAISIFESAFETFATSNYRPSWIYWAASAHRRLGNADAAVAGFRRVIDYYRNSYYGREAAREIAELTGTPLDQVAPPTGELPATLDPGAPPANAELIRALLAAGLYGDAIREIRYLQRADGSSPLLEATISWALARQGEIRPSITAMRRAYPQFMARGGEALPSEILQTIFPLEHWRLIERYSTMHGLDPYVMSALIAQESTFQADVRSAANAWGLMQIVPGTGRRFASKLGITPFRTSRLTEPETNVRIGMQYFADLMGEFGTLEPSLASYNAGEHRVRVWLRERPGFELDEFVDDIPFPETQNYVKRIVGTTADYRLLYGHLTPPAGAEAPAR